MIAVEAQTIREPGTIRTLFATKRPIDRPIEKVIDYYATTDDQLRAEVEEYEVTTNVERNFRRFLDHFSDGVSGNRVTETGVWVSGFYGSGKSSFTKYLGFALDPARKIGERLFLDLLAERIGEVTVVAELRAIAARHPVAVIMLDLGAEQLASAATAPVSTVLYWKVLQWAGYSKVEKLAALEFQLDRDGRLAEFRRAYADKFEKVWDDIHNDPLVGVGGAAQLVPAFLPKEYPDAKSFRELHFSLVGDVRNRADEILQLVRRKTGRQNVLFVIDEVGQYVSPRSELILNLDGLVRSFKEIGEGHVWVVATAQQTLAEIVEKVAFNSSELNRLRDRFPINIELDATDIREITSRRLLTKSAAGETALRNLFRQSGASLVAHTRLSGSALYRGDVDEATFLRLYPFLPQHFDLLLDLVRSLARSTGRIGLRSAIRVIQDVLVDTSKVLAPGSLVLADCPVGRLATTDQFFDTLRADIGKALPHVVAGVDRVRQLLPGDAIALRVAKAVAALQPVEKLPRTGENIAALLYARVGEPSEVDAVRDALRRLVATSEIGLVDDPEAGGFTFLSDAVKPLREKRNSYRPTTAELSLLRSKLLSDLFDGAPIAVLEGAKTVRGAITLDRAPIVGDGGDATFRILFTDQKSWDDRRDALLLETTGHAEWRNAVAWLAAPDESVDYLLGEIVRSNEILRSTRETDADRDVAQFIRAERRAKESREQLVNALYRAALFNGILIFRGAPAAVSVAGKTIDEAAKSVLGAAAAAIFPSFRLAKIRPATDLAAKFLAIERLDRMPAEADPLDVVTVIVGRSRVDPNHPTLVEALRAFGVEATAKGVGRLTGNAIQDLFAAPPYGWSKDATRYVFAALLVAGEVVVHNASGEVKTAGPTAIRAFGTTTEFAKVGVSIRGSRPKPEALDRAATRLEAMFGVSVLPLESEIGGVARKHIPARLAPLAPLAPQLRLLGLKGAERAEIVIATGESLVQGDGSGAVEVLGASDCAFPDDLSWAEAASRALAGGAANDLRTARGDVADATRLADSFPAIAADLLAAGDRDTLNDVLDSESFYLRLADLRTLSGAIRARAMAKYGEQFELYAAALAAARQRLETHPDWLKATDEDRAELAGRLAPTLAGATTSERALGDLNLVSIRRLGVGELEAAIQAELARRIPVPRIIISPPVETIVDLADLISEVTVHNVGEISTWLDGLRVQLEAALGDGGQPLRVRVRQ